MKPTRPRHARPPTLVATATATVVLLAALVALPAGGLIARAHATADPTKARHEHPSTITISDAPRPIGADQTTTTVPTTAAPKTAVTTTTLGGATSNAALGTPNTTPHAAPIEDLDDYIAGIIATIPAQWRVEGWSYTIVDATPNGAMGDTWGPDGTTAPYSQYSRSLMTPLMSSPGGQSAIEMVVLHEAMNAKAYSVVDANDWSSVAGWPATFAASITLEPGYNDIDAAANCLELGALGFSLSQTSGYAESDIVGGCNPNLANWLTAQIAAAG